MKALALDPGRRWNTAKELADATLEVLSPPPPPPPRQPEQSTASAFIFERPATRTVGQHARRPRQSNTHSVMSIVIGVLAGVMVVMLGIWFAKESGTLDVQAVAVDSTDNSGRGTPPPNPSRYSRSSTNGAETTKSDAGGGTLGALSSAESPPRATRHEADASEVGRSLGLSENASDSANETTRPPAVSSGEIEPLSTEPSEPITAATPVPESAVSASKTDARKSASPSRTEPPFSRSVSSLHEFRGLTGTVRSCQLSPDEDLVVASGTVKPVIVWNVSTGREVCRLDQNGRYVFFDGPDQIVTLGREGKVCRWSVPDGRLLSTTSFRGCLTTGSHSPVRNLAIYVTKSSPSVFDLSAGRDIWTLPSKSGTFCVAMSNDGTLAVTGEQSGHSRLWSIPLRKEIREFPKFNNYVQACAISPDQKLAVIASWSNTTGLFEIDTGKLVRSHPRTSLPMSAAFSPDGRMYAVGCNGEILIWETATGRQVASISGHSNKYVESLFFSRDGSRLLSGGRDSSVYLWQLPSL